MAGKWYRKANSYKNIALPNEALSDRLPNGIYDLQFDQDESCFFLNRIEDEFQFSHKIYGLETEFVKRVIKTYKNTTGNLGILFNGTKGTGKTVTTKQIANLLNNPVIMVNHAFDGLLEFFAQFNQDITIIFDEFEKNFIRDKGHQDILLSLMDGLVSSVDSRKVFLLTTNEERIQPNFIERPSRIRYVKNFGDLSIEVVKEIIEDLLVYPEFKEDIINLVNDLNIVTVDILKQIINEVNIHNESPYKFYKIFNVRQKEKEYKITNLSDIDPVLKKPEIIGYFITPNNISVNPSFLFTKFENEGEKKQFQDAVFQKAMGQQLTISYESYGQIKEIDFDNKVIICDGYDAEDNPRVNKIHFSLNTTSMYVV